MFNSFYIHFGFGEQSLIYNYGHCSIVIFESLRIPYHYRFSMGTFKRPNTLSNGIFVVFLDHSTCISHTMSRTFQNKIVPYSFASFFKTNLLLFKAISYFEIIKFSTYTANRMQNVCECPFNLFRQLKLKHKLGLLFYA